MPKTISQIKARIDLIESRLPKLQAAWNRQVETPGPFVTGRSNRPKSLDRQLNTENTRMSAAFAEWTRLRDELTFWQRRLESIEAGEVNLNGQPRADSPSRQARARLDEALADYCRATLKPGDTVYVAANPDNPLTIKRINKKSITCDSGTLWTYAEIMTPAQKELGIREFVRLLEREGYLELKEK